MNIDSKNKVNIVVMGKTGAGKSTLINALLGKAAAPEGPTHSTTRTIKNEEYTGTVTTPSLGKMNLHVYDTVGLEIDKNITQKTISNIEKHIREVESSGDLFDVSAVWFCINAKCNRFENYELDLIKRLSVDNCIPFIIVITQCLDNKKGELENHINEVIPEIPVIRVLSKEYETRIGKIEPYGVEKLLLSTIQDYPKLKISVATRTYERLCADEGEKNNRLKAEGDWCVRKYTEKAKKAGFVPLACILAVHMICAKMISELNSIFGIKDTGEAWTDVVLGLVVTPFMAVPLLSIAAAESYVETVGENYVDALMNVIKRYSNYKIEDSKMILEEIKSELIKQVN